jgi:hypothetical protein
LVNDKQLKKLRGEEKDEWWSKNKCRSVNR